MEGKIVSYKEVLAIFLILSLVQTMLAANIFRGPILPGKPLGCSTYNEPCNLANWCCPGTECSNSYTGGTCVDDPFAGCKHRVGDSCGFFDAPCCGKMECTNGECADTITYGHQNI